MKLNRDILRANVIVHVARTWERIRLDQDNQEMPLDNIASVDVIVTIADSIMLNEVVKSLLDTFIDEWDWYSATGHHCSDSFFEELAMQDIYKVNDMSLKYISQEDYIFWDHKNDVPLEDLSTVYHYTSVIDLMNQDINLGYDESVIRLTDLPFAWQIKINNAIKKLKEDGKDS